jgi:hypothetical protein
VLFVCTHDSVLGAKLHKLANTEFMAQSVMRRHDDLDPQLPRATTESGAGALARGLFYSLPNQRMNALFSARRADDRRRLNREMIFFDLNTTLLGGSAPRLIP